MSKKFLFVIDMQNDFIDGVLGTSEAQAIVPNVINKINTFAENNSFKNRRIIMTRDTHFIQNYAYSLEGKKLPVPHCIEGTRGWEINSDIMEAIWALEPGSAWIYDKYSFGDTNWKEFIESNTGVDAEDIESIEIVGLCTDICVISNAIILKALFPDTPIIVDSSCCAGVTPSSHQNALDAMGMCQIDII